MDNQIKHLIESNTDLINAILELKRVLFERDWTEEESSQYCELAVQLYDIVYGFYVQKTKNGNQLRREINAFYIWANLA